MIAVWFSSGAASAVAAYLTVQKYALTDEVRVINNPVLEEDEDNIRFLNDVQKWIGVKIETAKHPQYPNASAIEVWDRRKGMSFPNGAPCTTILKKESRKFWEVKNKPDWHVLGFTVDELKRHERFVLGERSNVIPVLIDAGMTKDDCYSFLLQHGIEPPAIYKRGYPNANCIGCVKATSPTYWNLVRNQDPEVFTQRAEQSRRLGAKLARYKGQRIFLDDLPPDAVGKPLKTLNFECGIFCEEHFKLEGEAA